MKIKEVRMKMHFLIIICFWLLATVFILMPSAEPSAQAAIDNAKFERIIWNNGHTYALTKNTVNWDTAKALAIQEGGYLVSVNDENESQFLSSNYGTGNPWIGLNDLQQAGVWVWANVEALAYTNWAAGEPGAGNEHCVMTNWETPGKWNNGNCSDIRQAIVEWNGMQLYSNVPSTGLTKCYNSLGSEINCSGTGQDGEIQAGVAWPNPRFIVSGECVTDNLTGLVWAKNGNLPNGAKIWQQALDYIASMNSGAGLCSFNDWRLPNMKELESLINAGEEHKAIWLNGEGFINVQGTLLTKLNSDVYWTSSSNERYPSNAWNFYMWMNYENYLQKNGSSFYIWPVRGGQSGGVVSLPKTGQTKCYNSSAVSINCSGTGQDGEIQAGVAWPNPRFSVNGDCVTDSLTGLMWTKNANLPITSRTWQQALDYIVSMNNGAGLCGFHDWHLPNLNQLKSLVNLGELSQATWLNGIGFINVQPNFYWSSTTDAGSVASAHYADMSYGGLGTNNKSTYLYVWPVRTGIIIDTNPPTPNPMTWALQPNAASSTSIQMTATTATDNVGPTVSYYFHFSDSPTLGTGGLDSGWQSSASYANSGLQPNHRYGYQVKARDSALNETSYSSPVVYKYTLADVPGSAAFFNITQNSIEASWTVNGNRSGTEYYCENTTKGTNSGWTASTSWNSTGLNCNAPYSFRVKARNGEWIETEWVSLGLQSTTACAPVNYMLTVNKNGTGSGTVISTPVGIDCGGTCSANFTSGTSVTLAPEAATGSTFTGWSGDSDCSDGAVTMLMVRNCTATFNLLPPSPVYRFWSGVFFYTINEEEKDYVMATWPDVWHYEGIAYYAYKTQAPGTLPVYRFWDGKSFFYTIDEAEKNHVIATWPDIWHYEGIAYYVYPAQATGTLPVYRFWSGVFFYTIDEAEKNHVIATWPDIWHYEGIAYYAFPSL
jgi:hypothetical protein